MVLLGLGSKTENMQVYAKLANGHKSAVSALLVVGGREPGGPDQLVSAAVDGTIAIWDPSAALSKGVEKEISPKVSFKAHDAAVLSLAVFYSVTSPELARPIMITTGEFAWAPSILAG